MLEERLDRYLIRIGLARSRREAREMVERGLVKIGGRMPRKGQMVGAGDAVEVEPASEAVALEPDSNVSAGILFEDEAVLVVNKPGGTACHPLHPGERGTVMNGVVARYPETAIVGDKALEGGLIHRLDNGTSGALLIARKDEAFLALRRAIRSGMVTRRYLALVNGHLTRSMKIDAPVAHHPKSARKMVVAKDDTEARRLRARQATSSVEPIEEIGPFTMVRVTPATGSRHQIRIHLASAGYPIVGDSLYGGPSASQLEAGRFCLHLSEIAFESPASGRVHVEAPLPGELRAVLARAQ